MPVNKIVTLPLPLNTETILPLNQILHLSIQSNPAISNLVYSKSSLFQRKIEFPWIYPYVFSIYYQLFRTWLFRIPRYFELIVLSLHLKSTPLFRTCQKQSAHIRAQLETYCILFELVLRN